MVSGVSYIYLSLVNMLYQPTMKTARYSKQHSKTFIAIQYIILVDVNLAEVSQLEYTVSKLLL